MNPDQKKQIAEILQDTAECTLSSGDIVINTAPELRQCSECFTMKNMTSDMKICTRCQANYDAAESAPVNEELGVILKNFVLGEDEDGNPAYLTDMETTKLERAISRLLAQEYDRGYADKAIKADKDITEAYERGRREGVYCDVCQTRPATRRGVEITQYRKLTRGLFCDTCVAYPNGVPTLSQAPEWFAITELTQTKEGE